MNVAFIANVLAPYVIVVLIVISVIAFVFLHFVYKHLKEKYFPTYLELGEPKIFKSSKNISTNTSVTFFIFKRKYREIKDQRLNRLCDVVFYLGAGNIVILVLFLLTLAIMAFI